MTCVGVAGWDYPDWEGVVYPAAAGRRFDRLAWIARFVDVVERYSAFDTRDRFGVLCQGRLLTDSSLPRIGQTCVTLRICN